MAHLTDDISQALENGMGFNLSILRRTMIVGACFRLLITNPLGSGKTVRIYSRSLTTNTSVVGSVQVFYNPTANIPTGSVAGAVRISNQDLSSTNTSVLVLACDASTLNFGTSPNKDSPMILLGGQSNAEVRLKLPPGKSIGLFFNITVAAQFSYDLMYYESST